MSDIRSHNRGWLALGALTVAAVLLSVALLVGRQGARNGLVVQAAGESISVDVDTTTPGVQSTRQVLSGVTFDVDIVVAGVTDLSGFQCDLSWSPDDLTYNSIANGAFLTGTWDGIVAVGEVSGGYGATYINEDNGARFMTSLSVPPAIDSTRAPDGTGVVARLNFTRTAATGTVTLDLNDCQVSAGVPPSTILPPTLGEVDGTATLPGGGAAPGPDGSLVAWIARFWETLQRAVTLR